ncbi:uncharacterized protein F5147DRAFT_775752 [Suillus discolor]|uniref:Ubiquitin-like protease family profile domain-containing protein n=1 Tax=Suillus discolor TaxID=1912936 RepID=A0A9P7F3G8_9AGAM|nr:uncharacterized protein F5147DRAFT_775752 [Suillus discolor]KAG2104041.1 hypothetical protein F5147DRAFT_775752 [Suillus discolor]
MASLLAGPATWKPEETPPVLPETEMDAVVLENDVNEAWEDVPEPHDNCSPQSPSQSTPSRRTQPDLTSTRLYDSWKALIPTLVEIQLDYTARTLGVPLERTPKHSCDAVNALASALHTHYVRRGYRITNAKGEVIQEPFCRSLGHAIQWFDVLQIEVERQLEAAIQTCHDCVEASRATPAHLQSPGAREEKGLRERCTSILIQRCPACFGAGDSPHFYDPSYFLPKVQVDAIGHHITRSHKSAPKLHVSHVPDEVINLCENSYKAVDGKKQKAAMDSFDNTGLMVLICRHDIPLFFANIDSPGEQQKYSVALINHLFSLLPQSATVVTLYDVGCVLSWSLNQYDILPDSIIQRLQFATTAMHAYGHEWACQLVYNPRMIRSSSRQHRLWLIDRHTGAIGLEMRADLGDWIRRRLRRGVEDQGTAARKLLEECEVAVSDLRKEWAMQKESQLSICAHALARLKKELDTVLALQADLDASDKALQTTRDTIVKVHERLMHKVEVLYASLNVQDRFPELDGLNLEFVQTLLLARNLKMNIRKRAIGSFFEWDKLDRAVGESQQALGTKLHQQTRKAIAKRQPALMAALHKFNAYCERLEALYDPHCGIPLPTPLPTKLTDLCNDQSLMEDIWITPSTGKVPCWLDDQDVRDGIRAMLKRDRCVEEQQRLGLEVDNLCRWFGDELSALELALLTPGSRFASHATDAVSLAHKLSGVSEERPLQWINTYAVSYVVPTEDEEPGPEIFSDTDHTALQPEDAALVDILTARVPGGEDDDIDIIVNDPGADLCWRIPEDITLDRTPLPEAGIIIPGTVKERVSAPRFGCPCQVFEPKDIVLLASRTALLNDSCVNGCAVLLYLEAVQLSPMAEQYAILSTHDLPRIRYNAPDNVLWRNMSWTSYWTKEVWILPIHRPSDVGHWVLCVVHLQTKELHLFDSFAERKPWKSDTKDIMKLIARLLSIARQHDHVFNVNIDFDGWLAHPLVTDALQTNGFDCGVWVLAVIAATLHGYHCTALGEGDMHMFRYYLRTLVLQIPVF